MVCASLKTTVSLLDFDLKTDGAVAKVVVHVAENFEFHIHIQLSRIALKQK